MQQQQTTIKRKTSTITNYLVVYFEREVNSTFLTIKLIRKTKTRLQTANQHFHFY